ncbi:hypothetical protein TNCV_4151111 [Trichonephila clavipes]|nr:hypothetical protein TNCV_4151111 [Trichonephila clavipes]
MQLHTVRHTCSKLWSFPCEEGCRRKKEDSAPLSLNQCPQGSLFQNEWVHSERSGLRGGIPGFPPSLLKVGIMLTSRKLSLYIPQHLMSQFSFRDTAFIRQNFMVLESHG